ncbi:MAG: hypothetical protein EHM14_04925 [Methanothrix sp.]|nr:MAG: hypothetical protein EHM14_04925 [Methanothrix sp.]
MPDSGNPKSGNWWLTHVLAPIFVLLLVGIFTAWLTNTGPFEPKAEISYKIETPLKILDEYAIHETNIKINNSSISQLYAQPVCIWNSGKKSIKDLDISYSFNKEYLDKDFSILDVIHNTSPQTGFGHINTIDGTNNSREITYSILNKKDHFTILFLINRLYSIDVNSRTPDLPAIPVTGADPCNCES